MSYRRRWRRFVMLGAVGIAVAVWVRVTATAILVPVCGVARDRWALLGQAPGRRATGGRAPSQRWLVRGRWLRVGSLSESGACHACGRHRCRRPVDPRDGCALPMLLSSRIVYALAMPFVA